MEQTKRSYTIVRLSFQFLQE